MDETENTETTVEMGTGAKFVKVALAAGVAYLAKEGTERLITKIVELRALKAASDDTPSE